jgi:hypothetical protein
MCALEKLYSALVLFGSRPSREGSEVLALSCFGIFFL